MPAKPDPDRFCIRAVKIIKALAVIIVKCELAVRAGINPQRRRRGHGLRHILPDRIKRDD